ncbi:hypothetical protein FRB99_008226 [Tulasnella sp. 403]|nr:hypothetical protein FRB99_008226 [Tulasnella sp. 403]
MVRPLSIVIRALLTVYALTAGEPQQIQAAMRINVSTAFFPAAVLPGSGGRLPDLIIHTSDSVFFYCHHSILVSKSTNMFASLLPPSPNSPLDMDGVLLGSVPSSSGGCEWETPQSSKPPGFWSQSPSPFPTIHIQQNSVVFNIVLHVIYDLSFERYGPTLDTVVEALSCLAHYGIHTPDQYSSIWNALAQYAPTDPIRVYSIAAYYGVDSVCVTASQYTLGISLTIITEGDALTMGTIHLRRLTRLHIGLHDTLKRVIAWQPFDHKPKEGCSADSRQLLKSAWQNSAVDILLQDLPQNTSNNSLASAFSPLSTMPQCSPCKRHIQMRIATVLQDWAMARRTV